MKQKIKLRNFVRVQFIVVTIIVALGLFSYIFKYISGFDSLFGLLRLLDVGEEQSIPTYFSVVNLLLSSVLLYVIFKFEKSKYHKGANYWLFLSILFFLLSIDESAKIHENFSSLNDYLVFKGFIPHLLDTHQWLPFGLLFVFVVGIMLLPFYKLLSKLTLKYFFISGMIFIIGALGFEYIGALMLETGIAESKNDLIYLIRRIFEEGFEMYGIALFNCALYREISIKKILLIITST